MNDRKPPTSLDKPPPGDDHAGIPTRVTRLEVMVEEVILRLDKLDRGLEKLNDKIDANQEKFNGRLDAIQRNFSDRLDATQKNFGDRLDATQKNFSDRLDATQKNFNDRLDASNEAMTRRLDALNSRFDKIYYLIFALMSALIAGVLGLLAKVLGVF
ncbi:hypothetical protein [Duganella sp. Root1480D1]|uniref:hypothetical protein n=1 Tax=Duganella sp. Root1480D1 TaxID=1736471 RepID=UPI00070A1BA3|nr:hypothetical protein [Duganella sp. Root1480D1]KQZ30395.1 hypothetical protein ASD58_10270 [Duganella sp. Root1480D1]